MPKPSSVNLVSSIGKCCHAPSSGTTAITGSRSMIRAGVIPVRDACRWLWGHSEGRRSYDRHRRIIGPRAYRSHTLGGRPKEDTHWRRFRHHDALNSRCYDGPPHRPRRSGPVPVWLRRADVVMKTPEFSFHDRRGAPNPRANTAGDRAWRRSVDGLELRMG